jgi:PRTRC genetic system ParB family protein
MQPNLETKPTPSNITTLFDFSQLNDGDAFNAPLDLIDDFPGGNIRRDRNPDAFSELRASIRSAGGVTQGVTVRVNPNNPNRLQLLAGYGRREASLLENFINIPAVFKVADDKQALAIMLSENMTREDLSLADEVVAAKRFISLHDGNYELAAAELNWSVNRLKGRLVLNQCSENVLNALHTKSIKLGHAEILSQFTEKLQNGTLEKIIAENWSIELLKERAGKAVRVLRNAKFNIDECQSCPHNSEVQASLFDNTIGKAKCANLSCYKAKTDQWIETQKSALEKDNGIVLLAIEKPESDRNLVSPELVGESQFSDGCSGCISNVVILQDGINSNCGETHFNQCIDTDCFRKMVKSFAKTPVNEKLNIPKSETKSSNIKTPTPKEGKDLKSTITQKTPASVIENNKDELRKIGAELYTDDLHFFEAFSVSSIIDKSSLNRDTSLFEGTNLKINTSCSFNDRVLALYRLTPDELKLVKFNAIRKMMLKTDSSASVGFDPRALMISALSEHQFGHKTAAIRWKPSKKSLTNYLKGGILNITAKSGFDAAYESNKGEGSLKKLRNMKKDDLVDEIVSFEFDWNHYVPDDYISILTK